MLAIFCSDPFNIKKVDTDFELEYAAAQKYGFDVGLIGYEDLIDTENPNDAVRRIKYSDTVVNAIYRGWMLKPEQYSLLYHSLLQKNIVLINKPAEYRLCHYLPESYQYIKDFTPRTVWLKDNFIEYPTDKIVAMLRSFGNSPVILKDYVKSRKHEWTEACFIPDASDFKHAHEVIHKFLQLQGEDLNEGIVLREYMNLEFLAEHSKSKMPLAKEYRIFFLNGEPLQSFRYWSEGEYKEGTPDISRFVDIAKNIPSSFFTMDIAQVKGKGWIIIEVGDGQVSGLQDDSNTEPFYSALKNAIEKTSC